MIRLLFFEHISLVEFLKFSIVLSIRLDAEYKDVYDDLENEETKALIQSLEAYVRFSQHLSIITLYLPQKLLVL